MFATNEKNIYFCKLKDCRPYQRSELHAHISQRTGTDHTDKFVGRLSVSKKKKIKLTVWNEFFSDY